MILTLSAPAKTFLVGEYAVLARGPALVLTTNPRFELRVTRGPARTLGIPDGAPAQRWLSARQPLVKDYQIEFIDPFAGAGGLGASGAQFLLTHTFTTLLQHSFERAVAGVPLGDVWADYQVLSNAEGSGADILAQGTGGVAQVNMDAPGAVARAWPYADLGFTLVRTHQKVPTHEHLATLSRDTLSLLVRPADACVTAFGTAPAETFVGLLNEYARALNELGLRAPATANLVERLSAEPWCVLAKGCGALGADVILILHAPGDRERVRSYLTKQSLKIIATDEQLSHGLEVKWT